MPETDICEIKPRKDFFLWIIIILAFGLRLSGLGLNAGEYTDGIIQLTLFENNYTFWPPLYTFFSQIIGIFIPYPLICGRLVSIIAGTLTIWPLYQIGIRIMNRRAVLLALLLYAVAPVTLRWDIRVMTDSLFNCLFWFSLYHLLRSFWDRGIACGGRHLTLGSIYAVLASLTRYEGLALVPLIILGLVITIRSGTKKATLEALAANLVWILFIGWMVLRGFGHLDQFAERAEPNLLASLVGYWAVAETFAMFLPYALTYPVFIFACWGISTLIRDKEHKSKAGIFLWTGLYLWIAWLGAHAAFEAFQFRYFLPMVPTALLLAGAGLSEAENIIRRKNLKRLVYLPAAVALVWSIVMSGCVLYLQRDSFGDIYRSAHFVRDLPAEARIYSNESYGKYTDPIKMNFASGREINYFNMQTVNGRSSFYFAPSDVDVGDYLVWHFAYGPDINGFVQRFPFQLETVHQEKSQIIPLLPDIMTDPRYGNHPAAIFFRYRPQNSFTVVFKIVSKTKIAG